MSTPYSPETLADRWGVSATSIRNKCIAGKLPHFRFGKLYRIPAQVVEEIESCQTSASDGCAAATASTGQQPVVAGPAVSFRHAPERKRKQKP